MAATSPVQWKTLDCEGHRLRYGISGRGPAVVIPRKDRIAYGAADALADTCTVLQVEPIGFGRSDRPEPYPATGVADQLLAACDAEGVGEFAVWGYSQGGAMACALARASRRARVLVCGGFNPLRPPSAAWLARMNRERRVPTGSRAFWNDFCRHDWHHEFRVLDRPALLYAGTQDRQQASWNDRQILRSLGVDYVGLDGLDHAAGGLDSATGPGTRLVLSWLGRPVGRSSRL